MLPTSSSFYGKIGQVFYWRDILKKKKELRHRNQSQSWREGSLTRVTRTKSPESNEYKLAAGRRSFRGPGRRRKPLTPASNEVASRKSSLPFFFFPCSVHMVLWYVSYYTRLSTKAKPWPMYNKEAPSANLHRGQLSGGSFLRCLFCIRSNAVQSPPYFPVIRRRRCRPIHWKYDKRSSLGPYSASRIPVKSSPLAHGCFFLSLFPPIRVVVVSSSRRIKFFLDQKFEKGRFGCQLSSFQF